MTSRRAAAFDAVRRVIGPETCPAVHAVMAGEAPPASLEVVASTAHNLRSALAALLVLHVDGPARCPNCGMGGGHKDACHLGGLLAALAG